MQVSTVYFEEASQEHTSTVLEIVKDYISKNPDVSQVVVATTEGTTGLMFAEYFGSHTVVVSHHTGFLAPNVNELDEDKQSKITSSGACLLTTTHAFAGVSRGIRKALNTYTTTEMLAYAYRTFGQGTKVCAEIAMMAADAGLIPVDRDVVCVGGTGRGADTAWVIQPTNTSTFTKLKMRACLCKPLAF
jgi:hypothetical protein